MERILTALGVTKQSSGMERDGLFSSASETTPEEERDLLLYSKYASSVQRVVSLPACRFVGCTGPQRPLVPDCRYYTSSLPLSSLPANMQQLVCECFIPYAHLAFHVNAS